MSSLEIAVLTMARDEGALLRRWVEHHARQVGAENVVVLDDGSADGSTDDLPCTVIRLAGMPGGRGFEPARMRLVSGVGAGLLAAYDYVAHLDADEFLVPDPTRFPRLADLLEARGRPEVVGVCAMDLVHLPGEAPLDLGRPLLEQRRHAKFAPVMCKPAVKRVPVRWAVGSHGIAAPYAVDPDLYMFHLKFADRGRLEAVAARRHAAYLADGRAEESGWSKPAEELLAMFEEAVSGFDLDALAEFDSRAVDLARVVGDRGDGVHRTRKRGLWKEELVRVPGRLVGAL